MRKALLPALVAALWLSCWSVCAAQEAPATGLKPLVTVSFSGYDALKGDIAFVGALADNPQMAQQMEGMLKLFTGGKGLAGLDTTKPWGAVVQTDGQQEFPIYGFVPVSDLKQLMGMVGPLLPGGPPEEPADGIYELDLGGPTVYVQQKGGWAFLVPKREDLAGVPADPQQVLGGLNQKYDLAVRASVKNVPVMFRQMFLQQIQSGAEMGLPRLPGESDEDYAIRKGVATKALQQVSDMVNDLDEILIGFAVDSQTRSSYVDFQITAVAGTKTAAQFAQAATAKTNFAGFDLSGAALTGNMAGLLSDDDVAEALHAITQGRKTAINELGNQGLTDDELKLATQLLSDLMDVLEKTIENKTVDGGLALMLKPGAVTFAVGGTIAGGAKLENALKQMVAEAGKAEPKVSEMLKLDAETHEGVRFHTLAIPTEEIGEEEASKLFGDTLNVVVGINETSVYLAVGSEATSTLKQIIDQSKAQPDKEVPPMRISVAATPIAQFAASMAESPDQQAMVGMVAAMLQQANGKDHLILTSKPISNGAVVRIELEEGMLKLLGSLGQMAGGMAGPPPGMVEPPTDNAPF